MSETPTARELLAELDRRRSFMQALSEVEPPREEGAMSETPREVKRG